MCTECLFGSFDRSAILAYPGYTNESGCWGRRQGGQIVGGLRHARTFDVLRITLGLPRNALNQCEGC